MLFADPPAHETNLGDTPKHELGGAIRELGRLYMATELETSKDSIIVLFMAGRLPTWDRITATERRAYEGEHVDLMLSVVRQHGLKRLESFMLMAPQQAWARFWIIELPSLTAAEAWIDAEMAPPYGRYGYYEYYLARRWRSDHFARWVSRPRGPMEPQPQSDRRLIPGLEVDRSTCVVLTLERQLPEAEAATPDERGDDAYARLMRSVASEQGLMRLEVFKLIAPQAGWHRAWLIEFPTLTGAEAWIEAELRPPHRGYSSKAMHLARNYFCADLSRL